MKIIIVRDKPLNFGGGIKKHCDDLYDLFYDDTSVLIDEIVDIPFWHIPILNKSIVRFDSLYRLLKDSECDVVHIHGFMSILVLQSFFIAKILNKRIIYSPHYHPFEYLRRPFLGRLFFHFFLSPFLPFAEKVITINNEDTNFFLRYHKNVCKIPHWINKDRETLIVNKKINNMILFVGRNDSNKGLEHLYTLPKGRYEVHCVTGGILKRDDFIQHQNISNKELSILYEQAGVVVVPSRYEAFSLVALEAMSHGTPIVISDRVRIGDYLERNKGCVIFHYHNFHEFREAVDFVINDSSNVDFKSIMTLFSAENIKEEYKKVYTSVHV